MFANRQIPDHHKTRLVYALQNDSQTDNTLFFVDKQKTIKVLGSKGLKLYQANNQIPDGLVHKVTDSGSPVKNKFINVNNDENYHFSLNNDDEFGRLVDSLDDDGRTEVSSRTDFDEMFSGDNDYLGSDEFGGPRFSIATGYKNRDKLKEVCQ